MINRDRDESTSGDRFAAGVAKLYQPIAVALILGIGAWMVNMDRSQRDLLHAVEAQTRQIEALNKQFDAIIQLDKRITRVEDAAFTRDRGEALDRRLIRLEAQMTELGKPK